MPDKRRSSTLTSSHDKKSKTEPQPREAPASYETKARIDPSTGQQSAFPGLEPGSLDVDGNELFYGPAEDGLAYLRMVRAEASGVPSMLLAPNQHGTLAQSSTESGMYREKDRLDSTGFWEGEAIVAYPSGWDNPDEDEYQDAAGAEEEQDPQEAFYSCLLERFTSLRDSLRQYSLSKAAPSESDAGPDLLSTVDENASYNDWYPIFLFHKPTTRFIIGVSHYATVLALSRLETLLTRRNVSRHQHQTNLGAWIWSMLAHCRDLGQLPGEEIFVLRDLAKTACKLERKLRASTVASENSVRVGIQAPTEQPKIVERDEESEWYQERGNGELEGSNEEQEKSKEAEENLPRTSPGQFHTQNRKMNEISEEADEEPSGLDPAGLNVSFSGRQGARQPTDEDEVTRQAGELEKARRRLMDLVDVTENSSVSPKITDIDTPGSSDNLLQALMMLDSIITVVGSVFGQRDLLEQRSAW